MPFASYHGFVNRRVKQYGAHYRRAFSLFGWVNAGLAKDEEDTYGKVNKRVMMALVIVVKLPGMESLDLPILLSHQSPVFGSSETMLP
jgi:hypothetical protein